jgi:tetratricopeptide (TPR) repeat protein
MRPTSQTPLLARLSAVITGLVLCASVSCSNAQSPTPSNPQVVSEIQRLMKQGQMAQAMEKTENLISSKPREAQGRFLKGLILTETGRHNEAIAVFTKLTEDFPELPEPYNNLAVLYAQQKQYDKARAALEMAIRTHPSYSIAHENLGDVYSKLASQAYDKALQLDSSNAATQTKLSMIKELISTSSKPGAKPTARSEPEPVKVAAAEQPKTPPVKVAVAEAPKPAAAKPAEKAPEPAKAPETKSTAAPTPKTPESSATDAKADKTPAAQAANTNESDVTKALQGWARAWSNKEVKAYLAYYASDFQTPNGMARKAWETERTQRIDKPGKLQVVVDDIKIAFAGDKATVRFRQNYSSASFKSSATKTIVFVKSAGKWLIQQERVG